MRSAGGASRWRTRLALAMLVLAGCHPGSSRPRGCDFAAVPPPRNEVGLVGEIVPITASAPYAPLDTYPLRVGDQITFTLSVDSTPHGGSYRLMVNDQLQVVYLHEPAADNRSWSMRVLPSGTVDLPVVGPVRVAGKTVEEAKAEINERAKRFYRHPEIAVTVTESSRRAEELRRAFSSGFTNQSLTVVVGPDGTINLPDIGTLYAFGRTLADLRDDANRKYEATVPGAHVWPHLAQRAPDHVYVLGEVRAPGRFLVDRPTCVSQAIALAGGWNLGAELREVVLIRYRAACPEAVLLDLHHAVRQDRAPRRVDLTDDILLADGDIVVVPKDRVQNANDFIRRVFTEGAYGVIPLPQLRGD